MLTTCQEASADKAGQSSERARLGETASDFGAGLPKVWMYELEIT